ncbi:MAG: hypothetical protein D6B26_06270 [Spirochaetaceae bacterium]|nr:MAG: hypothetical protein D6B26_06270 [Spirochaetaceae bacterium]
MAMPFLALACAMILRQLYYRQAMLLGRYATIALLCGMPFFFQHLPSFTQEMGEVLSTYNDETYSRIRKNNYGIMFDYLDLYRTEDVALYSAYGMIYKLFAYGYDVDLDILYNKDFVDEEWRYRLAVPRAWVDEIDFEAEPSIIATRVEKPAIEAAIAGTHFRHEGWKTRFPVYVRWQGAGDE